MKKTLYIDIGSTSVKWSDGTGATRAAAFPPPLNADGNLYEVSAPAVLNAVKAIIDGGAWSRVYFSVQMHGYVLLPDTDGGAKPRYVSWRDRRSLTDGAFDRFRAEFGAYIDADCGTAVKANLSPASIFSDYERGKAFNGTFCSLGSYIVLQLTGVNVSHITDLAANGFYRADSVRGGKNADAVREKAVLRDGENADAVREQGQVSRQGGGPSGDNRTDGSVCRPSEHTFERWRLNERLAAAAPFRGLRFPECASEMRVAGLYGGVELMTPAGDMQCAVNALPDTSGYVLNLGTAAQLCCVGDGGRDGAADARDGVEYRPYFGGKRLLTVTGLPGGAVISERLTGQKPVFPTAAVAADGPVIGSADGGTANRTDGNGMNRSDGEKYDAAFAAYLAESYAKAQELLPPRAFVSAVGGAVTHYPRLIAAAAAGLKLPVVFESAEPVRGLMRIEEGINNG
jgi:hypothetical protein